MAAIPTDSALVIEDRARPEDPSCTFVLPNKTHEDLKNAFLPLMNLTDALPSDLRLTFWEIELNDSDSFS
jgi:hypothetical protein